MRIIPYVILLYSPFVWYKLNAAPYQVYVDVSAYTYASNNHGHLNGVYTKVVGSSTGEVYYLQYPDDPVTSGSLNKIVDYGTSWRLADYDGYPIDERFTDSDSPVGAYQSGVTVIVHEENNPDPPPDSNGTGTGDQDNDVPTLLEIKAVLETLDSDDDVPKLTSIEEKLQEILTELQTGAPVQTNDPVDLGEVTLDFTEIPQAASTVDMNQSQEEFENSVLPLFNQLHEETKDDLLEALGVDALHQRKNEAPSGAQAMPVYDLGTIADTPVKIDLGSDMFQGILPVAKLLLTGFAVLGIGYYTFTLCAIVLTS